MPPATSHWRTHHNFHRCAAGRIDYNNYKNWDYEDSHLSPEGWHQAHALAAHCSTAGVRPQLVVVSPLTRAIETAVGAFGDHGAGASGGGRDGTSDGAPAGVAVDRSSGGNGSSGDGSGGNRGGGGCSVGSSSLLMAELTALEGRRSPHPAVALGAAPPFLCMELCREHLGVGAGLCLRPVGLVLSQEGLAPAWPKDSGLSRPISLPLVASRLPSVAKGGPASTGIFFPPQPAWPRSPPGPSL